jgi:hypothetical protein
MARGALRTMAGISLTLLRRRTPLSLLRDSSRDCSIYHRGPLGKEQVSGRLIPDRVVVGRSPEEFARTKNTLVCIHEPHDQWRASASLLHAAMEGATNAV